MTVAREKVRIACNTKWNTQILEARDGILGSFLPKDIRYLKNMAKNVSLIEGSIITDEIYKKWIKTSRRKT